MRNDWYEFLISDSSHNLYGPLLLIKTIQADDGYDMPSTLIDGHVLCQPTRNRTTYMWFVKPQKPLRRPMCFANPRTIKQLPQATTPNPNTINVLHSSISLFTAATPVPGYEFDFAYFFAEGPDSRIFTQGRELGG